MEVAAYLNGYFFILSRKHESTLVKQKKGLTGQAKTRKRKENFVFPRFRVFVINLSFLVFHLNSDQG